MLAGFNSSAAMELCTTWTMALSRYASLRENAATEFMHNSAMAL
jgi:hypothetical protein